MSLCGPFVFVALVTLVAACGAAPLVRPSPDADSGTEAPAPPEIEAPVPDDGASSDAGSPPVPDDEASSEATSPSALIVVLGKVVDPGGNPIAGRAVTLVDEGGAPVDTTTDEGGGFRVPGVSPPYDVAVASPGTGADPTLAYLGLSDAAIVLHGSVTMPSRMASLFVIFDPTDCGTPSCVVSTWTQSTDDGSVGSGSIVTSYFPGAGAAQVTVPLAHQWVGSEQTTILALVLVSDTSFSRFWWGGAGGVTLTDGVESDAGPYELVSLPTAGTMTAEASMVGIPSTWGIPAMQVLFDYPTGLGQAVLAMATGVSVASGIPSFPGGAAQVLAVVSDPSTNASATALSSPLPVTATSVSVALVPPPDFSTPVAGGSLQASDTITWDAAGLPAADYELDLVPPSPASPVTVFLTGTSVALPRLAALGISFPAGAWSLDLVASRPFVPMDTYAGSGPVFTGWSDTGQVPVTLGP